MTKRRIAFFSVLFLFLAGAASATPGTNAATGSGWAELNSVRAGQPALSSPQLLDEQQLAEYTGTGAVEAACAFGTGAGIPLAVAGVVVSSLLIGIPGIVLAIGGAVCMAVL